MVVRSNNVGIKWGGNVKGGPKINNQPKQPKNKNVEQITTFVLKFTITCVYNAV